MEYQRDCTDINENFTLERDATTGIVSIKKKGAEGNGGDMIVEDEEQEKKLEELANIYLEKYPSLVTSKEMALCFAKFEIMGNNVRDETGVLVIGIGGMVYYNAQDPTKGWGISYSGYDSTIYSKIKEAFDSGAIVGNMISDYEKWVEWLMEKEIDFELTTTEEDLERSREENYSEWLRITSSLHSNGIMKAIQENIVKGGIENVSGWEDWEQAANQESETKTKTDIIVKLDGSRVLVITMNIGGMETTMSLEISKPTDTLNETANQEVMDEKQSAISDSNLSENQVTGTSV